MLIVVHEFLHAAGYVYIGKASWRDVKFGIIWKQFMPYAHCRVPLRINHYRMAVFLPVILGVVPLTYAFFYRQSVSFSHRGVYDTRIPRGLDDCKRNKKVL
ncbi:DUF3267 domain-containing protein [Bacillus sp. H-16]|uniref:DUF3267 domain-containing protein n=1 Tax=Alteribacter salitolerans TaxID=2912333 RepID=UPI0019630B72|nr:DUF3267 domain-containing protein [Alteribacter salitolerans]